MEHTHTYYCVRSVALRLFVAGPQASAKQHLAQLGVKIPLEQSHVISLNAGLRRQAREQR